MSFLKTLDAVLAERERQDEKWGEQNHPDGTGTERYIEMAVEQRERTQRLASEGKLTWQDIFLEEVLEALAESSADRLTEELVHSIAVAFSWIEAIERRLVLGEPVREQFQDAA